MSITAGYYRNWSPRFSLGAGGNDAFVIDNLAVTAADFDPYCITAPVIETARDGSCRSAPQPPATRPCVGPIGSNQWTVYVLTPTAVTFD